MSQELANAVAEKQKRDERQYSEYISKGTPTVAVVTRTDGGMHPAFQAAFQKPYSDASGVIRQQFGPLLRDGGERRLNVLITRARRRCEVFSNLTADDLRVEVGRPGLAYGQDRRRERGPSPRPADRRDRRSRRCPG